MIVSCMNLSVMWFMWGCIIEDQNPIMGAAYQKVGWLSLGFSYAATIALGLVMILEE